MVINFRMRLNKLDILFEFERTIDKGTEKLNLYETYY